jgi:catechol 2,3-dioxygenase-like lactoylglutathione lyase family enzyme
MDNVGVVVDDLEAATAFFVELGMELLDDAPVEGRWLDRIVGLDDVRVGVAFMRTPDGHSQLELTNVHTPARAELVGELVQYEDSYRLCYVRGPEGIIVALAEPLS